MQKLGKYRAADRMSDLVCGNFHVLLIMSRFGIALGFGDRTVAEVCRTAGVSRNVYYRSYDSIPDILREHMVTTWRNYASAHQAEYPAPEQLGELFCAYIYSERRFITLLNRDGLMQVLEDLLYESLGPGEDVTGADLYLKSCWAYLVYGFIVAMVRSGFTDRPEEIAALLKSVQHLGDENT